MADAERIWLEPECCAEPGVGRTWCSVNEWTCCPAGECDAPKPTEYVRADLVAAREAAAAEVVEVAAKRLESAALRLAETGDPRAAYGLREWAMNARKSLPAADALARAIEDERLNPWKAAVIGAMLCFEDLPREGETPREALNRHIAREQEVALDPAVSQAARDLTDRARAEEREACIVAIEKHAAEIGRQECCGIGQSTGYGPPECCGNPALMISDREAVRAIRARGKETNNG